MMSDADRQNRELEGLLKRLRPAEPSAELKARVTGAARKAWKEAPEDIPWRIPLKRLAVSVAAAIVIVSSASYFSEQTLTPWRPHGLVVAQMETSAFDELPELPYSPFLKSLVAARRPSSRDISLLFDYMQKVRETVGVEQNGDSDAPAPVERRSRLLPTRLSFSCYS
jgi:hypothetical protein